METRINKPKGIDGQKLYLLVHHGYDFDPTVLAVCSTEDKAKELFKEHYANPENKDMPWNGVALIIAVLDDWIDYNGSDKEHGDLVGLAKQAGLI